MRLKIFNIDIGIIYSLTDTVILLSHDKIYSENLNLVKETLIKNGYPLDLLNEKIVMRYKLLMSNKSFKNNINETSETKDF